VYSVSLQINNHSLSLDHKNTGNIILFPEVVEPTSSPTGNPQSILSQTSKILNAINLKRGKNVFTTRILSHLFRNRTQKTRQSESFHPKRWCWCLGNLLAEERFGFLSALGVKRIKMKHRLYIPSNWTILYPWGYYQ